MDSIKDFITDTWWKNTTRGIEMKIELFFGKYLIFEVDSSG